MKVPPSSVPEKNPVSGQPNAFYGWSVAPGAKGESKGESAAHTE